MNSFRRIPLLILLTLLAALSALADWQTATVGLGNGIRSVAVDPVRNRIFSANYTSNTVTVVDGSTNTCQTWNAGKRPYCTAFNPVTGKLYVSQNRLLPHDTVVVFDTLGNITARIPVKSDPRSMVVDAKNNRVYVANYGSDTVSIIQDDAILRNVAVGNQPISMAFNPIMENVWLACSGSDSITVISLAGLLVSRAYSGQNALDVCVNAANNRAYVANYDEDSVTVFDCSTYSPYQLAKVGVGDAPVSIVCSMSKGLVFTANYLGSSVSAIHCSNNTLRATTTVKTTPSALAINSSTNLLYVSNNGPMGTPVMMLDYNGVKPAPSIDSLTISHNFGYLTPNPVTNKIYVMMECGDQDSLAVIDCASLGSSAVAAHDGPVTATVNQLTGDAYFANSYSDDVTVIKASGDTATIAVGDRPCATAVNPLTNQVFVCNYGSKSVSVINGFTYEVDTTIIVDTLPFSIAVNPVTNKIYVGSWYNSVGTRIKVIDGKDWDTTSVQWGVRIYSIAVNSSTNRIYACSNPYGTVTVIDGARDTALALVVAGDAPQALAVNPATNKIYCVNSGSDNVTVIDGATNSTTNVTVGDNPLAVAVDQVRNKVYVTNNTTNTVTEIDGNTNGTSTIAVGTNPWGVAADPVTGKVFVCNISGGSVSVIDCASRKAKTVAASGGPRMAAANLVTGKVYVACNLGDSITVIDQVDEYTTKLVTTVDAVYETDHKFGSARPEISGKAVNRWADSTTSIRIVLNNPGTAGDGWNATGFTPANSDSVAWDQSGCWGKDSLLYGENIISYLALDDNGATTNNCGDGTPFAGNLMNYAAYRVDRTGPAIAWWDSLADDNEPSDGYGPYPVRAVITDFSGIDYANLNYRLLAGKAWPYVVMTRADGDTFVAAIPAQTLAEGDTAVMSYMISAVDHANTTNINSSDIRVFNLRNLTGVAGNPAEPVLPKTYALQAAYPNPSRGQVVIKYQLPKQANVHLQIYNIAGQVIKSFEEGQKPAGYHEVNWNDSKLSNGIYFYQLKAGEFSATKKMVVLK